MLRTAVVTKGAAAALAARPMRPIYERLYGREARHTKKTEHENIVEHTTKKTRSRVTQKYSVVTTTAASNFRSDCSHCCVLRVYACRSRSALLKETSVFFLEARHIDAVTSHRAAAAAEVLELE